MTPQQLAPRLDRRLLLLAAALGGIVVGLLLMKLFSSDGDDLAVGIAPQAARVPVQTTTTLPAPVLSADAAALLVNPRDPFGQIVSVPGTPQAGQEAPAAPALAAQVAQTAQRAPATTKATTATTTTTTTPTPANAAGSPTATPPPAPQQVAPNLVWGTVGPVAMPGVPVNVCVVRGTSNCSSTAPATSITLTAAASIDPAAATAPTVLPAACSNGGGAALLVNTGSAGTTIYVSVVVMANGSPAVVSLTLPAPTPNEAVILSACVAPGVGVPSAGAGPPPPPTGGLLDGLLSPLVGLLGSAPVSAPSGAAPALLGLPLS